MDDDEQQHEPKPMILAQAFKIAGGHPYSWRPHLERIEAGIDEGHQTQKSSSALLSRTVALIQSDLAGLSRHLDPQVRAALKEHYELGLEEAHEFAETHQLKISESLLLKFKRDGFSSQR